ncbi:MAG TPA: hypothetical protein VF060_17650 [Trebonia sp.]
MSTQDVLNRFVAALGGTLKLIADFGDEQLKIALLANPVELPPKREVAKAAAEAAAAIVPRKGTASYDTDM